MFVTRILDVAVLCMVAIALLLPRPDITLKPALRACGEGSAGWCLTEEQRARVAELQTQLLGTPGEAEATLELANLFLDAKQPDWALSLVESALAKAPDDHRLHTVKALAFAERWEPDPAYAAAKRALFLCESPSAGARACDAPAAARAQLLESTLRRLQGVDMRKQPYLAKERIMESLRPGWVPRPRAAKTP